MEAAVKRKNIPIQVDCVCSTRGKLTPRWFRYEDEEGRIQIVYIEEILGEKELNYVGTRMLQFICRAVWEGTGRIFELRYLIGEHKWSFFRLVG